ncbi:protoporphyrinogen oxidase [Mechercharimyces sp. CAU 1602]|uniref:protoporphyrinogen oxidase n=1 Tax=Mechercharimyces sp. CAU 1602 TaxID=2973933 RepID=UPI00216273F5|nr:protoporphyrinogen oxidase [Mechercharimyces sp. CAU 1602]MCS1351981.1 protoporphyrinogen oxidase [Mechercharimyces sp. CAU 1602]
MKRVAIIGGGLTGLTTAYYLQRLQTESGQPPLSITLIEARSHLGGKIETEYHDDFVIERGPDSFLERKQAAAELVTELGMEKELIRNETGQAYILKRGRLHPIPEGAVMGIPTRLAPFVTTSLISPLGKLRAAADLFLPPTSRDHDISVGQFFRRRLGDDVVTQVIEPLLSGIYAGDMNRLSLTATFPQFIEMEAQYRSLILGMKKTRPEAGRAKKKGQFLTLKKGLSSLVQALENSLRATCTLRTQTQVRHVVKTGQGYELTLRDGETLATDAVVMAVPHAVTQRLLGGSPYLDPLTKDIKPTTVATVALGYRKEDAPLQLEGTGFVVPRTEPTSITACTWTHKKWPHTTPANKALLRAYVGRSGNEEIVDLSDEEIVSLVREDIRAILSIDKEPLFYKVTRWRDSMPQYEVGHTAWLQTVRSHLYEHFPRLFVAGASYDGVGLPDCIESGKQAAENVFKQIARESKNHLLLG